MSVYPSRRSHSVPAWVTANTVRNVDSARLVNNGNGFEGAWGGIPFPQPEEALEVYWNHLARWRGQYMESRGLDANVYANGKFSLTKRLTRVKFHYYDESAGPDSLDDRLFSLLSRITAPAQKAGNAVLVIEPLSPTRRDRSAWAWDSGRRRVLRAPQLAFDMAVGSADGLHTADDVDLINGSPERFDWQLKGKRELIIPYNCYALELATADKQLLQTGHLAPGAVRYERHRVWVLEGTLKPEWRHVYSRRVLYLDEDSWMAVLSENYDAQGQLWRVNVAYPMNYYELPATLPVAYVYHDLNARRYHVKGLSNATTGPPRTREKAPADGHFTPQGLRRFAR
jgi:hypothetical protein